MQANMNDLSNSGVLKGEFAPCSKLNIEQVKKIKELYFSENYSQNKLAQLFNVSQVAISCIILGKTWGHI